MSSSRIKSKNENRVRFLKIVQKNATRWITTKRPQQSSPQKTIDNESSKCCRMQIQQEDEPRTRSYLFLKPNTQPDVFVFPMPHCAKLKGRKSQHAPNAMRKNSLLLWKRNLEHKQINPEVSSIQHCLTKVIQG